MATSSLMLRTPDAEILDGREDNGIAEDDGADAGAGAGDGVALLEQPVHDEGVEDEHDADQRLPELHGRVLVVVAARRARFGPCSCSCRLKREVTCIVSNIRIVDFRTLHVHGLSFHSVSDFGFGGSRFNNSRNSFGLPSALSARRSCPAHWSARWPMICISCCCSNRPGLILVLRQQLLKPFASRLHVD